MTPVWPASLPQLPDRDGWKGGPIDQRAIFQPDYGPPILRRRTTASVIQYDVLFRSLTMDQRNTFIDFDENDLSGGVLSYEWIEPMTVTNRLWLIGAGDPPYSFNTIAFESHDLSFNIVRLARLP